MPALYNIPASDYFVETLAAKLLDDCRGRELDLAGILILLPNHRACRSLAEAFVRKKRNVADTVAANARHWRCYRR